MPKPENKKLLYGKSPYKSLARQICYGFIVRRAGKAPPAEFYPYSDFLTGAFAADTTTDVFLLSPE